MNEVKGGVGILPKHRRQKKVKEFDKLPLWKLLMKYDNLRELACPSPSQKSIMYLLRYAIRKQTGGLLNVSQQT